MGVVLLNTHQVLSLPCFLVVDFDLPDCLKAAPLFQHRDRQPELAILVLQPVTGEPASAPGKLDVVVSWLSNASPGASLCRFR